MSTKERRSPTGPTYQAARAGVGAPRDGKQFVER